jgi:hypothetical protein
MRPEFDNTDAAILVKRQDAFDNRQGPRVGDLVHMLDGTLRRFTHDWGDEIQTSLKWDNGKIDAGSFYLADGYCLYSGGLDHAVPKDRFQEIGVSNAPCWFFHHDFWGADRGMNVSLKVRVYKEIEAP